MLEQLFTCVLMNMLNRTFSLRWELFSFNGGLFQLTVAWHAALLRPDRFRAVIGLSVPFIPRDSDYPSRSFPESDDAVFYQSYFQSPGVAERDLEQDVRLTT
jgi:hypothetical protein